MNRAMRCLINGTFFLFGVGLISPLALAQTNDDTKSPAFEALKAKYEKEDWDGVIQGAGEALKRQPESVPFLGMLGAAYVKKDDYAAAEKVFEQIRTLQPDSLQNDINLCVTRAELKRADALIFCEKTAEKVGQNTTFLYQVGRMEENAGDDEKALSFYRRIWDIDKTHMAALTAMTSLEERREHYEQALALTEAAIANGLTKQILYLNATILAYKAGQYEKTIKLADTALEKTGDLSMRIWKADALNALGRYDEAQAQWDFLAQNPPGELYDVRLAIGRGKTLLGMDKKEALAELEKVKDAQGLERYPAYHLLLGYAYLINEQYDLSEKAFADGAVQKDEAIRDGSLMMRVVMVDLYRATAKARQASGTAVTTDLIRKMDKELRKQVIVSAASLMIMKSSCFTTEVLRQLGCPPSLIQSVEAVSRYIENPKGGGCGCEIARQAPSGATVLWGMLLGLLGLLVLRRRSVA